MGLAQELQAQQKDLGGGFLVRRLLPAARRRSVGPFVFFDHFGPVDELPDTNHDVRPHPHIGLATVTYLFEGAMMHRDSLGNEQRIEPGAINWMSAGSGIVHSERKPDSHADISFVNHGLQLWVALPVANEEDEPSFAHTPAPDIPELTVGDARVRMLVGSAFGATSPVKTAGPTLYLDVRLPAGGSLALPALSPEMAVYRVDGEALLDGAPILAATLTVLEPGVGVMLSAVSPARLVVIGGAPLDAPRHMWWNFVSSRPERIVQAAADWQAQRLGRIAGETEFIPLPPTRFVPPEPMS